MRKAVLAVGLIVIALAGLVFLLPMAINSDTLRTALARQLSEASGAQIALNGPIHFSVVPDFGIVAEDLSYTTADGALSATAERSVASAELLPLLSGQVRITGIELKSPRIVLADAAAPAEPEPAAVPPAGGDDVFKTIAGYLERLSINNVVVSDGEVARNNGGAVDVVASAIEIHLSAPGISQPASLSVSGLMASRPSSWAISDRFFPTIRPVSRAARMAPRARKIDEQSRAVGGSDSSNRPRAMR